MEGSNLFDQFPAVTSEEWMNKIREDLRGADFGKKMIRRTSEGYDLKPFYRAEDLKDLKYMDNLPGYFPFIRGTRKDKNCWLIRQDIKVSDYEESNRKALDILMKGVDSVGFVIQDPVSVNEENFKVLLRGIHAASVELNIHCDGKAKEILDITEKIVTESGTDLSSVHGAIEADPLSRLMLNGTLCIPEEEGFDYLTSLTLASAVLPNLRTIHLGACNFSNAGSNIAMELAFAVSMGCEYMDQLTSRGLSAEFAASKIRFSFGVGSDYFQEIAKLRAARLMWSAVMKGFDPGKCHETAMKIHSVTSRWNKTLYDPYVNMLRTQTEAMSAVLGGAESITVEPFDQVFRTPDDFSERIARNQQLLLREEAYFDKVADPSAGSYYIENLTRIIGGNAWHIFTEIEGSGGFLQALKEGSIQSMIRESAEKCKKETASRKKILIGINQYPDPEEMPPSGADISQIFRSPECGMKLSVDPVNLSRCSEEFELIRISVALSEKRPAVFLFSIGNPVMRKARAQFSAGFFGCAGYRIIDNPGFESIQEGVNSFLGSGADIAVICSSDEEYMEIAPEIYSKLKGRAIVVVAGNPSGMEELRRSGIEHFIHLRSEVPLMLKYFNRLLGIGSEEKGGER
jgi:methylmalonyl-CoA mutase